MPQDLRAIIGAVELVVIAVIWAVFAWRWHLRRRARKRARKDRIWRNLGWENIDENMDDESRRARPRQRPDDSEDDHVD
jgi:hypothetical protein